MRARSNRTMHTLVLGSAAIFLAPSAANGADLFIAGAPGQVWTGDSVARSFEYFTCTCNGPIQGIANDSGSLYAADSWGQVVRFDAKDGHQTGSFFLGVPGTAMVKDGADLLVSGDDRVVRRVSTQTGIVVGTLDAPIDVEAMVVASGRLYVGGPSGDIWSAPVSGGEFTYFACACFPGVRALAQHDGHILVGAANGILLSIVISTATFDGFHILPATPHAMAMDGALLLVAGDDARLYRVNPVNGDVVDSAEAPFVGDALHVRTLDPTLHVADLNSDGAVNTSDLSLLLGSWGACAGACAADLNGDSFVNHIDLAMLLGSWG